LLLHEKILKFSLLLKHMEFYWFNIKAMETAVIAKVIIPGLNASAPLTDCSVTFWFKISTLDEAAGAGEVAATGVSAGVVVASLEAAVEEPVAGSAPTTGASTPGVDEAVAESESATGLSAPGVEVLAEPESATGLSAPGVEVLAEPESATGLSAPGVEVLAEPESATGSVVLGAAVLEASDPVVLVLVLVVVVLALVEDFESVAAGGSEDPLSPP
jgi:hypothetical protein